MTHIEKLRELKDEVYKDFVRTLPESTEVKMDYLFYDDGWSSYDWFTIYNNISGKPLEVTIDVIERRDNIINILVCEEQAMEEDDRYWIELSDIIDVEAKINLLSDLKQVLTNK